MIKYDGYFSAKDNGFILTGTVIDKSAEKNMFITCPILFDMVKNQKEFDLVLEGLNKISEALEKEYDRSECKENRNSVHCNKDS